MKAKDQSWWEAAIEILKKTALAMHYTDIAAEMLKQGLGALLSTNNS